jgi:hypothetical protein
MLPDQEAKSVLLIPGVEVLSASPLVEELSGREDGFHHLYFDARELRSLCPIS